MIVTLRDRPGNEPNREQEDNESPHDGMRLWPRVSVNRRFEAQARRPRAFLAVLNP